MDLQQQRAGEFPFTSRALILIALLLLLLTFTLILDDAHRFRWVAFLSWLGVVGVILCSCFNRVAVSEFFSLRGVGQWSTFLIVAVSAVASRLAFLERFPFTAIGDQARDAGLLSQFVYEGTIREFFSWGSFQGYGMTIPILCSPFYWLFGPSVLSFRVPSGLVSSLDIVLLFFLVRLLLGVIPAFVSSVVLIFNPYHLFFGRTEVVVGLDSLWTTLLFTATLAFVRGRSWRGWCLLMILSGIGVQLHAAIRPVVLLVCVVATAIIVRDWWKAKEQKRSTVKFLLIAPLLLVIGCGPILLFESWETLLMAGGTIKTGEGSESESLLSDYLSSLAVYGVVGTTPVSFLYGGPLFSPLLAGLMVVGMFTLIAFRREIPLALTCVVGLFLFPLTHSAITNLINVDHRLLPLLNLGAIAIGAAFFHLYPTFTASRRSLNQGARVITALVLSVVLSLGIALGLARGCASPGFFLSTWNSLFPTEEYLLTHAIQEIERSPFLRNRRILHLEGSEQVIARLELAHNREQLRFRLPHHQVFLHSRPDAADTELYITLREDSVPKSFLRKDYCEQFEPLLCPPHGEKFSIFLQVAR